MTELEILQSKIAIIEKDYIDKLQSFSKILELPEHPLVLAALDEIETLQAKYMNMLRLSIVMRQRDAALEELKRLKEKK